MINNNKKSIILTSLVALFAFSQISIASASAEFYVSGGGGGGKGSDMMGAANGGDGGFRAGGGATGTSGLTSGGGGGGAYVGDNTGSGGTATTWTPAAGNNSGLSGAIANAGTAGGENKAGSGGSASYTGSLDTYDNIYIMGGNGGETSLGQGGVGGHATAKIDKENSQFIDVINVFGGDTGSRLQPTTTQGGDGGNASLSFSGNVDALGVNLIAGEDRDDGGAKAGNATFKASKLTADTINLIADGGRVFFDIKELSVSRDVTIDLKKTVAGDVNIKGLSFSNGSTLNVTKSTPTANMTFKGYLEVIGSGNTLNSAISYNASGETISFRLPSNMTTSNVLLTVSGVNMNVSDSIVKILGGTSDFVTLQKGDSVTLVDGSGGLISGTIANNDKVVNAIYGSSRYGFEVSNDNNGIYAVLRDSASGEFAKAYLEVGAAKIGQQNIAADAVISQISSMASSNSSGGTFASMGAYSQRLNSGSHVDAEGMNIIGGVSTRKANTLYGVFAELGLGNYDSYNSFSSANVEGEGDSKHYGLGAFFNHALNRKVYIEGSLRVGYSEQDFKSGDLVGSSFDTDAMYYGLHIGAGYKYEVSKNALFNNYAQVILTHQDGDTVKPIASEKVEIDAMNSIRTRIGSRYEYNTSKDAKIYAGLAVEYELDAEQKGKLTTGGVTSSIDSPSLKGATGVVEVGGNVNLGRNWSVGANINGYAGKREGFSGNINIGYEF